MKSLLKIVPLILVFGCADSTDMKVQAIIEIAKNDIGGLKEIMSQIESPNYISLKGDTPLVAAACNGNLEIVEYLIGIGAKKDFRDRSGMSAAQCAKENEHIDIVEYLKAAE